MKEIKEKPTKRVPRSNAAGKIPKASLKNAWTEAKEKAELSCEKAPLRRGRAIIPQPKILAQC